VSGLALNMAMIVLSEKPRTNAARPTTAIKALGRAGQVKVCPTMNSAGPV
jgi:hypothetical protein